MFVGCTSNQENEKLQQLVSESKGYALLDSGCTNTVCGEVWMDNFVEKGNNTCWIGGLPGEVTTDVVDCNIPLSLSNKSMEAVGFIWDFKKHEVKVNNRCIKT